MSGDAGPDDGRPPRQILGRLIVPFVIFGLLAGFFFGIHTVLGQVLVFGSLAIGCIHVVNSLFGPDAAHVFVAFLTGAAAWYGFSTSGWSIGVTVLALITIVLGVFAATLLFGATSRRQARN